ncbi:MAG: cupredoxin domain-containing protein [Actinomycetota bacterium]
MVRRLGFAGAAVIIAVNLPIAPATGGGGGGCYGPLTAGSGGKAEITGFCFEPTVVRVRPGDSVTWVNRDEDKHTVTGANGAWGDYDILGRGDSVTYRFKREGTYPYFCSLHVGMVGTVVVGDGRGQSILTTRASRKTVTRAEPPPQAAGPGGLAVPPATEPNLWPLGAAVAAGIVGLGLGRALARSRVR